MEDAAIAQLISTSQLEGMQRVAGMPDAPWARPPCRGRIFSSTHLHPALVGSDIGCGMALWQTDLKASAIKLDKLEKRVGNIDGPMEDRAVVERMAAADLRCCEHEASLGTVGGGNHFAEFQQVDAVYLPEALAALGIDKQRLLLLVHSGSRGLGERILRAHVEAFGHQGLRVGTAEAMAYLEQHEAALRFAQCNRHLVAHRLLSHVRAEGRRVLELHHNHVASATIHGQTGWLHRKEPHHPIRGRY
jgi:release factor H-coupled RctB family protein